MDLDKPVHIQIASAVWHTVQGDLGTDIVTGRRISMLIGAALPHTLILAWTASSLAAIIGIPPGVYSATHPDSWPDRITAVFSISLITIPSYMAGPFLLLIFAVQLQWMPAIGLGKEGNPIDYIKHLILPATALAITWIGYLARFVRASLLEVLNQTHIRAAMHQGADLSHPHPRSQPARQAAEYHPDGRDPQRSQASSRLPLPCTLPLCQRELRHRPPIPTRPGRRLQTPGRLPLPSPQSLGYLRAE